MFPLISDIKTKKSRWEKNGNVWLLRNSEWNLQLIGAMDSSQSSIMTICHLSLSRFKNFQRKKNKKMWKSVNSQWQGRNRRCLNPTRGGGQILPNIEEVAPKISPWLHLYNSSNVLLRDFKLKHTWIFDIIKLNRLTL